MASSFKSLVIDDTGYIQLPNGTVAQRPTVTTNIVRWTNTGTQAVSVLAGSATTTSTSWTCPAGVTNIEVLVIAGGGGGASGEGGGGGAGGVIYNNNFQVTPTTAYTVTVGAGGTGNTNPGGNGSNSVFGTLTAIGGGGGGQVNTQNAASGGSGGGGGRTSSVICWGGAATSGQGHAGGTAHPTPGYPAAGGGGAGGVGQNSIIGTGLGYGGGKSGDGGPGLNFNITGTPTYYAGGGGGGGGNNNSNPANGVGGVGGGGAGGLNAGSATGGVAGTASTGGGGGGGGQGNSGAGGGSGVVIIRYSLDSSSLDAKSRMRFNTETTVPENFKSSAWDTNKSGDNIVTNGLVVYLDGKNTASGATVWNDTSGNGNNATLTNGPTYSSANGGSVVFDGTNDYAISGAFTQHQTTTVTLSAWVYPNQISTNSYVMSFGGGVTYGTARGLRVNGGQFQAIGYGTAGTHDFNTTGAYAVANTWQHVCCVWNGTTATFYLNGRPTTTTTLSGLITPTGSAYYISSESWSNPGSVWNGKISCASIYSRSLTPEEVAQNYEAQRYRFELLAPKLERPALVQGGLMLNVDAGNKKSYPGWGDKWYDLADSNNVRMTGSPTFYDYGESSYFTFNGSSQYGIVGSPVPTRLNFTTGCSLCAWINPAANGAAALYQIVGTQYDAGGNRGATIMLDGRTTPVGKLHFQIGTGSAWTAIENPSGATSLATGTWYYICAVWGTGFQNLCYINGVLDNAVYGNAHSGPISNVSGSEFSIGRQNDQGRYFNGSMGMVHCYNRPLNGTEILQNYNATKHRYGR